MPDLTSEVEVARSPETVFDWFQRAEDHFVKWHPDHKEFQFTSPGPPEKGTTFFFLQYIAGRKLATKGVLTEFGPGRFAWKALSLPMRGAFEWEAADGGARIVQRLSYGVKLPAVSGIADWFVDRFYLPRRDVQEHMDYEMAAFKEMLEAV